MSIFWKIMKVFGIIITFIGIIISIPVFIVGIVVLGVMFLGIKMWQVADEPITIECGCCDCPTCIIEDCQND